MFVKERERMYELMQKNDQTFQVLLDYHATLSEVELVEAQEQR